MKRTSTWRGGALRLSRTGRALWRGGRFEITSLATEVADNLADEKELTQVSEALDKLAKIEAPLAAIVDLKFFCGFSFSEIAAMQGVSERTVQRKWERARLYLHRVIRADLCC